MCKMYKFPRPKENREGKNVKLALKIFALTLVVTAIFLVTDKY